MISVLKNWNASGFFFPKMGTIKSTYSLENQILWIIFLKYIKKITDGNKKEKISLNNSSNSSRKEKLRKEGGEMVGGRVGGQG